MNPPRYSKSKKYTDLQTIYAQCSGPGGLKLAEFMAEKMKLTPNTRLLDVGTNRGFQTCFLAKEYNLFVVGIDPLVDRDGSKTHIEYLMENARSWGVSDAVLGVQLGVPDTRFAANSFDAVYSTTTLEMIRGWEGEAAYQACIDEIYRVLKPGGVFGLGEPMHFDIEIPDDLVSLVTQGSEPWAEYFTTVQETASVCRSAGFEIEDANYAPDARLWWEEYAAYDPFCQMESDGERKIIQIDNGRWLSFGYVIAKKLQS